MPLFYTLVCVCVCQGIWNKAFFIATLWAFEHRQGARCKLWHTFTNTDHMHRCTSTNTDTEKQTHTQIHVTHIEKTNTFPIATAHQGWKPVIIDRTSDACSSENAANHHCGDDRLPGVWGCLSKSWTRKKCSSQRGHEEIPDERAESSCRILCIPSSSPSTTTRAARRSYNPFCIHCHLKFTTKTMLTPLRMLNGPSWIDSTLIPQAFPSQ